MAERKSPKEIYLAIWNDKIIKQHLEYAFERWQDEFEYEELKDFAVLFKEPIENHGAVFGRMRKSPHFGFTFSIMGKVFRYECTGEKLLLSSPKTTR